MHKPIGGLLGLIGMILLVWGLMDRGSAAMALMGWLIVWLAAAVLIRGGAILRVGGGFLLSLAIAMAAAISLRVLGLKSPGPRGSLPSPSSASTQARSS